MKNKMLAAFILSLAVLTGCGNNANNESQAETSAADAGSASKVSSEIAAASETEISAAETSEEASSASSEAESSEAENPETESSSADLSPLPASVDINNLTDCSVSAFFSADDFDWMGGNLTFEVYDTLCYDTVDVNSLAVGDTIDVGDAIVTVDSIDENGEGTKIINAEEETEIDLMPMEDGGIYKIWEPDDFYKQVCLGETQAALSEDVSLTDCTDTPDETKDVSSSELKEYTENLSDGNEAFYQTNTTLTIENGEITHIERVWIP